MNKDKKSQNQIEQESLATNGSGSGTGRSSSKSNPYNEKDGFFTKNLKTISVAVVIIVAILYTCS